MTKERPILFSGAMVRAILDGRKTQRRRVWKMPRGLAWYVSGSMRGEETGDICDPASNWWGHVEEMACPYGQPGDRLWVRETWKPRIVHACFDMACDCETVWVDYPAGGEGRHFEGEAIPDEWFMPKAAIRGRSVPSLHMPRWASRLVLEIAGVRVERLNDCSEADAIAEGIERDSDGWLSYAGGSCVGFPTTSYASLWDSINGAGAWEANPWVWVVEFRRVAA